VPIESNHFFIIYDASHQMLLSFQFAAQVGKSKMNTDPPDEIGRFKDTGLMVRNAH
jgi:hypothetical protein